MPGTATRAALAGFGELLDLGDLDPEILRAALQIIPGECATKFRLELVPQGHRVMVVQKDKVIAHGEFAPGFENESVFYRTGDRTDVHYFVIVDE